ncbi:MAG: dihydroneopterin triphosphate 2'-epimerase [Chromatiales bacterium]|nr:dihydroneopterin triphosphate 2'-epimerase [Chromatiales bacterium]
MNVTIRIKNLRLRTLIGFSPHELDKPQDVVINVALRYAADTGITRDEVDSAVNYRDITKAIIDHVEDGRFELLEKLTADVLEIVTGFARVQWAEVEVDKPHALRFADSVSCRLASDS